MRIPLLKPLKHLLKQRILLPELGRELVHVGVRRLALEPQLGESADDVLDPVREEEHEGEVLELAVHRDRLVLLRRARDIDAVLRLALGDDACVKEEWIKFFDLL
jgi:hypothetical protein